CAGGGLAGPGGYYYGLASW
nr:immunoglobulin heavy chain junction region [Macaca mulatta]MOV87186.1 immunoglobulin heavy chain junction region [Macaca mulatta]MOV88698.1 immunoglobulin heavy chain junction region [Macaca mulatta]MOV89808.1 immunoglobulin heavy chain junction region [Macaca mulatta]